MEPDEHGTEELGLLLFEVSGKLRRRQEKVLRSGTPPLTYREYRALYRVNEGHDSVTAIAQLATIGLPSVSAGVVSLVDRGLLERRHRPGDHRSHALALTAEGKAAMESAHARLLAMSHQILDREPFRTLSDRDRRLVTRFVTDLVRVMQEIAYEERAGGHEATGEAAGKAAGGAAGGAATP